MSACPMVQALGAYLAGERGLVTDIENFVCETYEPRVRKQTLAASTVEKQVATAKVNGDAHVASVMRRASGQPHSAPQFVRCGGKVSILTRVASKCEGFCVGVHAHRVLKQGCPVERPVRQLRGQMQRLLYCRGVLAGGAIRQDEV
eukprot:Transcript_10414.p2 GENE.Transcript_10414~~Transcript_10414.p2  ORF type:complete len:146 (+),score=2.96 Transcript_10414:615-1052(+)